MSPRRLPVTDIRPEVHAQVGKALRQALVELVTPLTPCNDESIRMVAERTADILRIPHEQIELSGDPPTMVLRFHGDCVALARARGWRHDPHD